MKVTVRPREREMELLELELATRGAIGAAERTRGRETGCPNEARGCGRRDYEVDMTRQFPASGVCPRDGGRRLGGDASKRKVQARDEERD